MKRSDRAYLAGIIDGEGCISLARTAQVGGKRNGRGGGKNIYYGISLSVEHTSQNLIFWLCDNFGGNYSERDRGGNRKPQFKWSVNGKFAKPVLEASLPYLKVKREVAELALEYIETIVTAPTVVGEDTLEIRDEIFVEMAELNRRGRA